MEVLVFRQEQEEVPVRQKEMRVLAHFQQVPIEPYLASILLCISDAYAKAHITSFGNNLSHIQECKIPYGTSDCR